MKGSAELATPRDVLVEIPRVPGRAEVGPAASAEARAVGAPEDLESVYRAHAAAVARWTARLAGPRADVEDLVHEVFLVVERRLPEFRGDARVTTWLYRITAHVVRAHRRKARVRRWLLGQRAAAEPPAPPAETPAERLEARERVERLYRALDRLGDKYRTVLILHELEGLSGPEIAELTGVKPSTVWVRLHRARAELLRQLGRDGGEEAR